MTLAEAMPNEKFVLQVIDWTVYSEAEMKKNLKARMLLSDGVSKMTCLVIDKAFNALVSENLTGNLQLVEIQYQELRRYQYLPW